MEENPNCEFCAEEQPSLTCSDCSLNLCESCCTQVHSKGKLANHKFTSYRCEVCGKLRAEVDCYSCDVGFCAPCFSKLHSRGAMALHMRALREPVDSTRQSLLEGLPGQTPQQLNASCGQLNTSNGAQTGAEAAVTSAVTTVLSAGSQARVWATPGAVAMTTAVGSSSTSAGSTSLSSVFCDGTCKTCPPVGAKPGYGVPRIRKGKVEGEDDDDSTADDEGGELSEDTIPLKKLDPVSLALLPCQHRVNQRLFGYRKTGDGWVGRELVGNLFTDFRNQTHLQFEVREDGIFCNICPPHRSPFSMSGDVSNLRSHAKSDLHMNHLTLRLTGQWPSCKPTGIMSDGSFSTQQAVARAIAVTPLTPVIVSPPSSEIFPSPPGSKGFRSPKQLFTPQEHELLRQLGDDCDWSKKNNAMIEKFAEQHGILPRRVKAWIGNHKPTRKKYRYSTGPYDAGIASVLTPKKTLHTEGGMGPELTISVSTTGEDGVTSYTVSPAISLADQASNTVTLLPRLPIPGEVVLPDS